MAVDLSLAEELGFNPYYPMIEQRSPGSVMISGRWFVDMKSNDYCGPAADRALMDIYRKTIERFGVSLCGTPIASGGNSIMDVMEKRLAIFIGCELVMTFTSCYQANTSLFSPICPKDDCISGTKIGVIHTGISPDFCKSYGIPTDIKKACEVICTGTARKVFLTR